MRGCAHVLHPTVAVTIEHVCDVVLGRTELGKVTRRALFVGIYMPVRCAANASP